MHWLTNLRFGRELFLKLLMTTVDSAIAVCRDTHVMGEAVLVVIDSNGLVPSE
jgi:hypothetical protein